MNDELANWRVFLICGTIVVVSIIAGITHVTALGLVNHDCPTLERIGGDA